MKQCFAQMVDQMVDEDSAIVSVFYGADVSESEAQELADAVEEKYPDLEVELQAGGQPVYYYVVSVE